MDEARPSVGNPSSAYGWTTALRHSIAPGFLIVAIASLAGSALLPERVAETRSPVPARRARVEQALAGREYHASENEAGLQAPNRAHDLRTYFGRSGIRVHDRTAEGSEQLLALSLVALGRGEALGPIGAGELVKGEDARVEIRRPGISEWYENSVLGLEQGFTLSSRPAGNGSELILELAVDVATPTLRGDEVVLETPAGRRLRYGKLEAVDARGETVAARLEVPDAGRIRIVVADAAARYPLTIDPLLGETADTRLESDQVVADLGWSVSGAGDVNGDGYDDVIVGAPFYDAGQEDEGAAFIFLGSATGIADGDQATAETQIESNQAFASLGASVSGAGDVNGDGYDDVIVGSDNYDNGQGNEGMAFVFLGSASGIADGRPETAAAQLQSNQGDAHFGASLSGAGNMNGDGYDDVIVGAPLYDAGLEDEGAAFVFLGRASGMANGNPSTAAAQLESNQLGARMGQGVAGVGDVNGDGYDDVIVGAYSFDALLNGEGAAFIYLGSASGIADGNPATAATRLTSNQETALLGGQVSGAGDVNGDGYDDVIVGIGNYDHGQNAEGVACVFLGRAAGIANGNPTSAATLLESNQDGGFLGSSVSGAGDVNGDGYDDVIVGANGYDSGQPDEGAAFVFLGSASGIAGGDPSSAFAQLEANQAGAFLGGSASGAGDVNGDGADDVIVGARAYDVDQNDDGAAFVYLPEPGAIVLLASGVAGLAWRVQRGRSERVRRPRRDPGDARCSRSSPS